MRIFQEEWSFLFFDESFREKFRETEDVKILSSIAKTYNPRGQITYAHLMHELWAIRRNAVMEILISTSIKDILDDDVWSSVCLDILSSDYKDEYAEENCISFMTDVYMSKEELPESVCEGIARCFVREVSESNNLLFK